MDMTKTDFIIHYKSEVKRFTKKVKAARREKRHSKCFQEKVRISLKIFDLEQSLQSYKEKLRSII